jgi:hypothetical protein
MVAPACHPHPRIKLLHPIICVSVLVLTSTPSFAELNIVPSKSSQDPALLVVDTSTSKVVGTFWGPGGTSDFGYDAGGDVVPEFAWSLDRKYVAVAGGSPRSRGVYLYQVVGNTLKPIKIPALTGQQAAPFEKLNNIVAEGVEVVRWKLGGNLLLHFWAHDRVTIEDENQREADVWAEIKVSGGRATIVQTRTAKP